MILVLATACVILIVGLPLACLGERLPQEQKP
jgi:hypothetical protein